MHVQPGRRPHRPWTILYMIGCAPVSSAAGQNTARPMPDRSMVCSTSAYLSYHQQTLLEVLRIWTRSLVGRISRDAKFACDSEQSNLRGERVLLRSRVSTVHGAVQSRWERNRRSAAVSDRQRGARHPSPHSLGSRRTTDRSIDRVTNSQHTAAICTSYLSAPDLPCHVKRLTNPTHRRRVI